MVRKKIIAGNWKMNNTKQKSKELVDSLLPQIRDSKATVVLCVPYTDLDIVHSLIKDTGVKLGAQNVSFADSGAYTGEISAEMLLECGVEYVIVGHSERRQYFGETDQTVNKRIIQALSCNLIPILCVGESEVQRTNGKTQEVCSNQLKGALQGIGKDQISKCIIAYEPIWAIGTGKTATADDANSTIKYIRSVVLDLYGADIANQILIQYGGSMNASNAKELLSKSDIDGGLIGGASLKANDFAAIVNTANKL